MAKKGVKFDNMSTGQKVVHSLGWLSVASIALSTVAMAYGAVAFPGMLPNSTSTTQPKTGTNGLSSRLRR